MAEQFHGANAPSAAQQISAVPTQNASQFMVTVSPNDFIVTLGHTRMAMIPAPNGQWAGQPIIEWLLSLSISPMAARALSTMLQTSIGQFEQTFGPIPATPGEVKIAEVPGSQS